MFLLPRRVYKRPSFTGIASGAVIGIVGTFVYVFVIRNPAGFLPSWIFTGIVNACNKLFNSNSISVPSAVYALDSYWPTPAPVKEGKSTALAWLSLLIVPMHLISPNTIETVFYRFIAWIIPGFRSVIVMPELKPVSGTAASVFGYALKEPSEDGMYDDDEEGDEIVDDFGKSLIAAEDEDSNINNNANSGVLYAEAADSDSEDNNNTTNNNNDDNNISKKKERKRNNKNKSAAITTPQKTRPVSPKPPASSARSRSRGGKRS